MEGDPSGYPDADRGDLAIRSVVISEDPYTAPAVDSCRLKADFGARVDEHLLDAAHMRDDVEWHGKAHDGVSDELPGAVPGDLAAAVHVDDRCPVEGPIEWFGTSARGVNGLVLEKYQGVGCLARGDLVVDAPLEVPGGPVLPGVGSETRHLEHM